MNDRIKLAEFCQAGKELEPFKRITWEEWVVHNFDPFTDANDDYAVLEWMRKQYGAKSDHTHPWFRKVEYSLFTKPLWKYQIGDYARACLKVLE